MAGNHDYNAVYTATDFTTRCGQAPTWTEDNKSSLALFSPDRSCFLSLESKGSVADEAAVIKEAKSHLTRDDYMVTDAGESVASVQLSSGTKQFTMHNIAVTGSGTAGKLYGGQSYGYIPLEGGHLAVSVHCDTINQLTSATAALNAITYEDSTM